MLFSALSWAKAKFWSIVDWFKNTFTKIISKLRPIKPPHNNGIDLTTLIHVSEPIEKSNATVCDYTAASKITIWTVENVLKQPLQARLHFKYQSHPDNKLSEEILDEHLAALIKTSATCALETREYFMGSNLSMLHDIFSFTNVNDETYNANAKVVKSFFSKFRRL